MGEKGKYVLYGEYLWGIILVMPYSETGLPPTNLFENPTPDSGYAKAKASREDSIGKYVESIKEESTIVPDFFISPSVNSIAREQVIREASGDLSETKKSEWGTFESEVKASAKLSTEYIGPEDTKLPIFTNKTARESEDATETAKRVQAYKKGNRPGTIIVEDTTEGKRVTALGWGPYEAQTEIGRIKDFSDLTAEQVDGLINSRYLPSISLEFSDKSLTKIELEKMAERARMEAKMRAISNLDFDLNHENPNKAVREAVGLIANKLNKGDVNNLPLPLGFIAVDNGNVGEFEIVDESYSANPDAARIIIRTGITSEGAPGKNYTSDVRGIGIKMGDRIVQIDMDDAEDVQKIIGYLRPDKAVVERDDEPTYKTPTPLENEEDGEDEKPKAPGKDEIYAGLAEEMKKSKRDEADKERPNNQNLAQARGRLVGQIRQLDREEQAGFIQRVLDANTLEEVQALSAEISARNNPQSETETKEEVNKLRQQIDEQNRVIAELREQARELEMQLRMNTRVQQKTVSEAQTPNVEKQKGEGEVEEDTTSIPGATGESARSVGQEELNSLTREELAAKIGIKTVEGPLMDQIYEDYNRRVANGENFNTTADLQEIKNIGDKRAEKANSSSAIINRLLSSPRLTQNDRNLLTNYARVLSENPNLPPSQRNFMIRDIREIRQRLRES